MAIDDHSRNYPSFFKIILEPRGDLYKLGIPIKFMAENGNDFMDVVSLKIPTGKTWKVELLKENGRAWFRDGWHEFVTYFSICHGHFLMFTYRGMSQFNVFIFDMTACEIEYPLDPQETQVRKTCLPGKFAEENLIKTRGSCTLRNATGDTWPVRCDGNTPKFMKFVGGWKKYALDNKLRVGDICVFELINVAKCLFQVEIIRCSFRVSDFEGVAGPSSPMRSPEEEIIEVILIDD
ncbi:B3 domain-containing transcription factor VRN1-like [Silene latifolia]|uniref:B3 domain-containing transcription factor VRN1-like n=1 Tax=Silene latifolia TaxID=37657 RepID=UPI003D770108